MRFLGTAVINLLAVVVVVHTFAAPRPEGRKTAGAADRSKLSYAVCPIVYPLDQSPAERGYHYIFYGNAFFINEDGYLLTAAHVLSQLNGMQPYIVLRLPNAPPRLLPLTIIATDTHHDVALLRATPNPFAGKFLVRALPLLIKSPAVADAVLANAMRPSRLKDPHSFDAFVEDRPGGQVLAYEFTSEHDHQDTELFLFSHEVLFGDSGAPVVAPDLQAVVGLVEGRWLRPAGTSIAGALKQSAGIGAAVPIHYAIPLLLQNGVNWHSPPAGDRVITTENSSGPPMPQPLSLVAPPYPSQALLGGRVVLDALVDSRGQLEDIRVLRGESPFVETALNAVRTWSFLPARDNGEAVESRIGVAVEFRSAVNAMRSLSAAASLDDPQTSSQDILNRGAVPSATVQPISQSISGSEGSVILFMQIDANGRPSAIQYAHGEASLAPAASSALSQWQFLPAKHAGANCPSTFIAVEVVRASAPNSTSHPANTAGSVVNVQH